ncbi:thiamine diphosphokinase [Peptostreptococcus canis]|uniref:thiamine diphosphokinase n=1 Tax=Peptostreptococcus canis TaxID=1159213 RepID=UPI002ED45E6C|nr:thiamine pyrophosphokinase [Peptostreptococcus canis]
MSNNFISSEKSACIILNGDIDDYKSLKFYMKNNNYNDIIAVDGGANHLYEIGIIPDYIIGDLDSIDDKTKKYYEEKNVIFSKFPSKKDETDAELAILKAINNGNLNIDIFAGLGGRIDHELANIQLLYFVLKRGANARILTESVEIYIIENGDLTINGKTGDIISVLPLKGDAKGVTLKNLEYPLNEFDFEYSITRGISNVMLNDHCYIEVKDGSIVVIKVKK